jgi:ABC-type transport system involved in multi-copper enzyme maturation permease subunit
MLQHIFAIAKNTFRETMRDRIMLAALAVVFLMILFSLFIGSISVDQDIRMIVDFGITAIYILQIFVAVFMGSMLIHKELERRTFYLIIPKPVRRESIILGKVLGLTATTIAVSALSTLALYVILYFKGGNIFFLPILASVCFSTLEAMLLIFLSLLFSGITSPILSAVFTIGIYLIGHSGEIIRQLMAQAISPLRFYAIEFAYYILPNLEKFNIRNDVVYEKIPTLQVTALTVLYAICYGVILFIITQISLKKKEF